MRCSSMLLPSLLPTFVVCLAAPAVAQQQQKTDQELIENAVAAAPAEVAGKAAVVVFDAKGKMRTLREGSNNFTCLPDDPANPANDPVCVDENGLEWVKALVAKKDPPPGKVGFGYMLQGGSTASNLDPYATEPPSGEWHQEPPHVMIFNMGELPRDYPQPGEKADMSQPWVMWAGTPYEHLMIPVE